MPVNTFLFVIFFNFFVIINDSQICIGIDSCYHIIHIIFKCFQNIYPTKIPAKVYFTYMLSSDRLELDSTMSQSRIEFWNWISNF